ncbi:helix-turn-helix domain-containing protein [bacterium]|jgi:excisionase family DNA binding protein|nr:helix-turn-helix domain-containing protein [bacterium]
MELLTKQELANYLKVRVKTVCYLLYSKQLPKIKVGREYRFIKTDIDKWIASQRQEVRTYSFKGIH